MEKSKEANAKLEASLKEIEERHIAKIFKLLLKVERPKAMVVDFVKQLESRDTDLAAKKVRINELEAQFSEL